MNLWDLVEDWELLAMRPSKMTEPEREIYRKCARLLRDVLSHSPTDPAPPPESEPTTLINLDLP